jgi:hypothetical protein
MNAAIPIWQILVFLAAFGAAVAAWDWFRDQYEAAGGRRFGFRLWRRWYGTRAWIILRSEAGEDEPERYQVLAWDQEGCSAPWVHVVSIDNEDREPFWAPVTDFAPEAVRRLSPWIFRYRWLRVPVLFAYRTLDRPAGYVEDGA